MKHLLYILCIIATFSYNSTAQITFRGCIPGLSAQDYTLTLTGTTNDAGTIRNTYEALPGDFSQSCAAGVCEIRIMWNIALSRWEIRLDNSGPPLNYADFLLYYNTTPSFPDPPDMSLGTWIDGGLCGGNGTITTMTGNVQSTVGSCSDPTVPTVTYSPATICNGNNATLTITGTLNDATGWYIYTSSCGGTAVGNTAASTFVVSPSFPSTTYYVRGEDGAGCVDEATGACGSVTVTVNATPSTPTISAGGATTFCTGGSVTLTSSSATGNQWSLNGTPIGGATGPNHVATAAGNYTVVVTTSGCPSAASTATTVTVNGTPSTPTISAGGATTFCTGGSVTLTSSSATGNQWSLNGTPIGGATGQNHVATVAGNYTVVVTTSGCPSAASTATTVTINVTPSTPTISAGGATTFCTGGSVTLTSSSATGNQWSLNGTPIGGATGQNYVATVAGNYTVVVTTSGCPSAASTATAVTVNTTPSTPTISAGGATTFCTGGSVTLTSSSATGNQWSLNGTSIGGATGQNHVATAAGNYTVVVTTSGCPSAASTATAVTVNTTPSTPTISAGGATTFCTGSSVTLTSSSATGNQWSLNGTPIGGATGQNHVATAAGNYTVVVTTSGCPSAASTATTVTVNTTPSTPAISPGGPTTFCPGGSVTLTSSSATGNQWLLNGTPIGGATNQNYVATASGNYTVVVTSAGCSSTASIIVSVNASDAINPTAVCQDINVYLDGTGNATIVAADLDGGGTDNCGSVTVTASQTAFSCADIASPVFANNLIISAVYDGPLTGGTPKGVELYVAADIADLSQYGLGAANNGGGSDGEEFTFPAVAATAGSYIYVASEATQFTAWFGFAPDYTTGFMGINGDDAIELFFSGAVIDVFGDINVDGTGQAWDYLDGWAYRMNNTGPDGSTFQLANWSFSGTNVLDGETSNALATTSIPVGTFMATGTIPPVSVTVTFDDGNGNTSTCLADVAVLDTILPTIVCPVNQVGTVDGSCNFSLPDYTVLATTGDNCSGATVTQVPAVGTNVGVGTTNIVLTITDASSNMTNCNFDVVVSDGIAPTALCQDINVYLDATGNATIAATDLDGGGTDNCGSVTVTASQTAFNCADIVAAPLVNNLIISAAYDGPLPGGLPKGVELYVAADIADLSQYGLGSANNGGGSDGEEFTFPAVAVTAGSYIYVASEATQFTAWFGFAPDYVTGSMLINGDDAVELFFSGAVIDVFGDINVDGTGQAWDYLDGWAYRKNNTGPDGSTFQLANWNFSGINVLDGENSNALATTSIPVGTFMMNPPSAPVVVTVTFDDGNGNTSTCPANVTVLDTILPTIACPGNQVGTVDASCNFSLPDYTVLATGGDNCAGVTVTQVPAAGTNVGVGTTNVVLTATDASSNTSNCNFDVVVSAATAPTISAGGATTFCAGGSVTLTSSSATGNQWSLNGTPIGGAINQNYVATTSGNYTAVVISGCPSLVSTTITVTVNNNATSSQTLVECAGFSITVGTNTYTTTGVYTDVLIAANGCDSTVTTDLTVKPAITSSQTLVECAGFSITVGTSTYTTTGIYTDVLTAVDGCDSTVTTDLTVRPAITSSQTLVECAGFSITVGTNTYTTTGIYTDVLTAADGCDSTVTTDLTVKPAITSSQTLVECAGFSITVGTSTYTTTGIYTDVLTAADGCDSTVTTDLTVKPAIATSQTLIECAGFSITVGTNTYTTTGIYTDVLTAVDGCDSTVTTDLTVKPAITSSQMLVECAGFSITVGTNTYTTTGIYTDVLTAADGCDSTVTTDLTVKPAITGSQTLVECAGFSITVGTSTYTTTGIYTDVLTAADGCDSTVTTDLTVKPAITGSQTLVECAGFSITVGTSTYTTTGIYTDVLTAADGCDSTVTTDLTVKPAITGSQTLVECAGFSITVGTSTYTTTGIYTDVLTAADGCDSTVTTDLTVKPAITSSQTLVECAGFSITVGTSTYTTTGIYTDVLTAADGCDSTVTTDLTVKPAITSSQTLVECAGFSITVGTSTYTTTGIYTDVLTAADGCDSTVTTDLTVKPAITSSQTLVECAGFSITVGTSTYTTTGIYTDVLTAADGCDSTVTTDLTVKPAITSSQTLVECAGFSITVGTSTYTTTGVYTDVLTAADGCDSTVTTDLTVKPAITSSQTLVECAGFSITVGTSTYTTTGVYTDVLTAADGCDSTVTTDLTVKPAITSSQTLVECAGFSITVGTSTYTSTGIYTDVLTAADGCDSTVTTDLTVKAAITTTQNPVLCAGQNITVGTSTYSTTGNYTDILTAADGCDSTVTTNLTVNAAIATTQNPSLCTGQSITVGTSVYTTTGNYTDVLTAADGCDSTVTTNLVVNSPVATTQNFTLCAGLSVIVGTNVYTVTGNYLDTLPASTGCDSVVTTNLVVNPAIATTQGMTLCDGQSVTVGTSIYTVTGNYTDTLAAIDGCDSIVITNLIVDAPIGSSQTMTLCDGQSITVGTNTYTATGIYTDVFTAANGCDSTVSTNLTVNAPIVTNQTVNFCGGNSVTVGTSVYTTPGNYIDVLIATNGCDSTVNTTLTVDSVPTFSMDPITPDTFCFGVGTIMFSGTLPAGGVYSGPGVNQNTFNPTVAGVGIHAVVYTITGSNGCVGADSSIVVVELCSGLEEEAIRMLTDIKLYPNPTSTVVYVNLNGLEVESELTLSVYDVLGRLLDRRLVDETIEAIDLSREASGVYLIRVEGNEGQFIQKVVKE